MELVCCTSEHCNDNSYIAYQGNLSIMQHTVDMQGYVFALCSLKCMLQLLLMYVCMYYVLYGCSTLLICKGTFFTLCSLKCMLQLRLYMHACMYFAKTSCTDYFPQRNQLQYRILWLTIPTRMIFTFFPLNATFIIIMEPNPLACTFLFKAYTSLLKC